MSNKRSDINATAMQRVNAASVASRNSKKKSKTGITTEGYYKEKVKALETKLLDSKQSVVRHILQARLLEKSLNESVALEKALVSHLAAKVGNGIVDKNTKYVQAIRSGKASLELTDLAVYVVERSCSIAPKGIGKVIETALRTYSDKKLVDCLNAVPPGNLRVLSSSLFCKLAVAASKERLSVREAEAIYNSTEKLLVQATTSHAIKLDVNRTAVDLHIIKWTILKSMLRRKLLLVHLTTHVLTSKLFNSAYRHLLEQEEAVLYSADKTTKATPSTPGAMDSPRGLPSLSRSSEHPAEKFRHRELLRKELQRSESKQKDLRDRISTNLSSTLFSNTAIPLSEIKSHKGALLFSRRVALEKFALIYKEIDKRALVIAVKKWKKTVRQVNAEIISLQFTKQLAAYRLLQLLDMSVAKKVLRTIDKLKYHLEADRKAELIAAIIELQRYWRGMLVITRMRRKRHFQAAVNIQKAVRRRSSMLVVAEMRKDSELKLFSEVVKKMKASDDIRRALYVIVKVRQARRVQRWCRGCLGRKLYRKKLQEQKIVSGTIKFQALCRQYLAHKRVYRLCCERDERNAAILIQRTIRGFLGRRKFNKIRRLHVAVIAIQYCWFCCKARRECSKRRKKNAATALQKSIRMFICIRRYGPHLAAKRELRHRKRLALARITPVVIGCLTRKLWRGRVQKHLAIRAKAANTIKHLLIAFKYATIAKKQVALLREERRVKNEKIMIRMRLERRMKSAATTIQRHQRGIAARKYVNKLRAAEQLSREKDRVRKQLYYKFRGQYLKTQDLYHREMVIKIQCAVRLRQARKVFLLRKMNNRAVVIQNFFREFMRSQRLKKKFRELEINSRHYEAAVTILQKTVRRYCKRLLYLRYKQNRFMRWFIKEIRAKKISMRMISNYRYAGLFYSRFFLG